ncbi:MAG: hypothetical protein AAFV45_14640 [Pseudomonadota bacterium]
MFYHLMAVLIIGVTALLMVYAIKYTFKSWNLPGYIYPMAIGVSMLGYNVWAEYSWYSRTAAALPAHIKVVRTYSHAFPLQPWTYLLPYTNRFAAVDLSSKRPLPKSEGLTKASLILAKRFEPTIEVAFLYDCQKRQAAEIDNALRFTEEGLPVNAAWSSDASLTPMIEAVCDTKT